MSERSTKIWRWVFLFSITSNVTVLLISYIQSCRGYKYVDTFYHPIRGGIIVGTSGVTTLFLVFASPLFFRGRLHVLAVIGWIYGVLAFLFECLPTF